MHGFGLGDLIRINQLVRNRIDFEGFRATYNALPLFLRRPLTYLLFELACQAGANDADWEEALRSSGLASDPLIQEVLSMRQGDSLVSRLYDFLDRLPDAALPTVFRLFVYLFGTAESRRFRGETKKHCNHWWHRDLLDERVVRDLMSDPNFYRSSMKDDDRIKNGLSRPWWRFW